MMNILGIGIYTTKDEDLQLSYESALKTVYASL